MTCKWCGDEKHGPEACPHVSAIDYYPDGTVKRVEFREVTSVMRPDDIWEVPRRHLWFGR